MIEMNEAKKNKVLIVIVIAILLGWVATIMTFRSLSKDNDTKEKVVYVNENEEKLDNFKAGEAVNTLGEILSMSYKDIDGKDRKPEERMEALKSAKDIDKVIDKDVFKHVYLDNTWGENENNQVATAVGLIVQSNLIAELAGGDFKPKLPVNEYFVTLDEKTSKAFVRLDVFVGGATGLSMEMEYIDGEWKLDPYTLVSTMELTDMIFYQMSGEE